jgi:hypothetical protein
MFAVLRKDADLYVDYVISLYDNGHGALGDSPGIWVAPSDGCLKFDPAGKIPPVDWVALASLRDSDNNGWNYDDTDDEFAGITMPSTLSVWLKKCGFTDRRNETNLYACKGKSNLKEASDLHTKGHTVCLFCKGDTLRRIKGGLTSVPSHWAVLTKPVTFSGSSVALQLFSWGKLYDLNVALDVFLSTYFGYVAGKP